MANNNKITLAQLLGPGTFKAFKSDRTKLLFHCHVCDKGYSRPDEAQRHFKLDHPVEWTAMQGDFDYSKLTVWTRSSTRTRGTRITADQYRKRIWSGKEMPKTSTRLGLNRKSRPAVGVRKKTNEKKPGGRLNQRPLTAAAAAAAAAASVAVTEDAEDDEDEGGEEEESEDEEQNENEDEEMEDEEDEDEEV